MKFIVRVGPSIMFWILMLLIALVLSAYGYNEINQTTEIEKGNAISEGIHDTKSMLVPISEISSSDIIIDISQNATRYIKGSTAIPYVRFTEDDGLPKSWPEISNILEVAGISQKDSIVIYGECMPCGGGPAPATFVYWIMKSLGHKNVKVLDGNIDDWAAAGLPISNESQVRPSTNYIPDYTYAFVATYEYVRDGNGQLVDARQPHEFNANSIPKAINIPYDDVLDNHTIKNKTALRKIFSDLGKDKTIVVFTNTGIKASVLWFALEMMGYDSKLYAYQDWLGGQAQEANTSN